MSDKIQPRKRAVIETVNDELKNTCQVKHYSQRSFGNFLPNIVGGLIVYSFFLKKSSVKYHTIEKNQLSPEIGPYREWKDLSIVLVD